MDDLNHNIIPGGLADERDAPHLSLQEWRISTDNCRFDLHADDWPVRSKGKLHTRPLREILRSYPVLSDGAIRTLAWYAENRSLLTLSANRCFLEQFFSEFPPTREEIDISAIANFRDETRRRDGHDGNGLQWVRPFLKKWHALGFPGVSDTLVERMKEWTLKKRESHARVNRRDPNEGPLEPIEQQVLQRGALLAYTDSQIDTSAYAIYLLLDYTGRRPEQLVRLKWKDMDDSRNEDAVPGNEVTKRILLLKISRIKGKRKWREHFRAVPMAQDDWNLLQLLRVETIQRFEKLLADTGLSLQEHDRKTVFDEMPMFPGWGRLQRSLADVKQMADRGLHGDAIVLLREDAASDAWEMDQRKITLTISKVVAAADVLNRDGEPLLLFSTRLRYTLDSNLFRMGCPPTVRAHNLDHDTLKSLIDYSKNSADRASRWSKATMPQMQRLASYFKVNVVDRESDATAGDDPELSRLMVANAEAGATCAIKRGCNMGQIPRCCYNGCNHFQPWLDGPHEAFLEELLTERDDFIAQLDPVKERATIEAADTLILSVAAVIHQCDERRAELAGYAAKPKRRKTRK